MNHESRRDVDQIQGAEQQRNFFPSPIAPIDHDDAHEGDHTDYGYPGWYAKNTERRSHPNKLGNQRQPVNNHQINKRKPPPKRAKTSKYGLSVTALGDRAQAHRHFL